MRNSSSWATRIALSAGATAGIVAACYNDVPGPMTPLPPREAPPQGPRPAPILATPIAPIDADAGSAENVTERNARFGAAAAQEVDADAGVDANGDANRDAGDASTIDAGVTDAGVTDAVDLPPVPDSDVPLLPPGLPHEPR